MAITPSPTLPRGQPQMRSLMRGESDEVIPRFACAGVLVGPYSSHSRGACALRKDGSRGSRGPHGEAVRGVRGALSHGPATRVRAAIVQGKGLNMPDRPRVLVTGAG